MKTLYLGKFLFITVLICSNLFFLNRDSQSEWIQLPGSDGVDIATSENGSLYLTNTAGHIYKFNGTRWIKIISNANAERIACNNEKVIFSSKNGKLFRLNSDERGYTSINLPTGFTVKDIAVQTDGKVWAIDFGRQEALRFNLSNYTIIKHDFPLRIAASQSVILSSSKIFRYNSTTNAFKPIQMKAKVCRDIATASDNQIFFVDGRGYIFGYEDSRGKEDPTLNQLDGSDGIAITVNNNFIYLVNTDGEIYKRKRPKLIHTEG